MTNCKGCEKGCGKCFPEASESGCFKESAQPQEKNSAGVAPQQSEEVAKRIMAAWLLVPHLRFGQFISSAVEYGRPHHQDGDIFRMEDVMLAMHCEGYAADMVADAKFMPDRENWTPYGYSQHGARHKSGASVERQGNEWAWWVSDKDECHGWRRVKDKYRAMRLALGLEQWNGVK